MRKHTQGRSGTSTVLRLYALGVAVVTLLVVWLLPGSTSCPSPPGEIDPLECVHSAFSPARDIVLIVGVLLMAALLIMAFVRDTD